VRQLNAIHNLSDSFEGKVGLEGGAEGMLKEALGVVNRCYELRQSRAGKSDLMMPQGVIEIPEVQVAEAKELPTPLKSTIDSLTKISASGQFAIPYAAQPTPADRSTNSNPPFSKTTQTPLHPIINSL